MDSIAYRGRIVQRWGTRYLIVEKVNGPFVSQKEEIHEVKIQGRGTWGVIKTELANLGYTATGWKRFSGDGELRSLLTKN